MTIPTDAALLLVATVAAAVEGATSEDNVFRSVVAERGEEMTTGVVEEAVKQVVVTRSLADGVHKVAEAAEHDAAEHNEQCETGAVRDGTQTG